MPSGLSYYRHSDWLGSARFDSTPAQLKQFDVNYAPYGEDYGDSGTTDLNFTGQNQDTVAGLYDFLYREYHPVSGRWISPDPAGLAAVDVMNPQTWNRYAYVGNSPLANVDPLGLQPPCGYTRGGEWTCANYWAASEGVGGGIPGLSGSIFDLINIPVYDYSQGLRHVPSPGQWVPNPDYNPDDPNSVRGKWAQSAIWVRVQVGTGSDLISSGSAANNSSWLWIATKSFFRDFSVFGPKDDPRPSCVSVALSTAGSDLIPLSPSVASVGELAAVGGMGAQYIRTLVYAAGRPNYLGGIGLIYPMKSTVVQGMLKTGNKIGGAGAMLSVDIALLHGVVDEGRAALAGQCK